MQNSESVLEGDVEQYTNGWTQIITVLYFSFLIFFFSIFEDREKVKPLKEGTIFFTKSTLPS